MATLLSINSYYYRRDGSEAVYLDHNDLFERRGWQVVPFAMRHPKNLASRWSEHFVDEIEFGADYGLVERLVRVPKVVYSLEARRRIDRLLDTVAPDVAHCHTIYHHLSPSILPVLSRRRVPVVMTLHDLKLACPAYHMYTEQRGICEACHGGGLRQVVVGRCIKGSIALSGLIYLEAAFNRMLGSYSRHVDRFVSPCRFYVDKLVEWGWPRERFAVVPNAMVLQDWHPRFEPGDYVLYFGRLSAEKGLMTLVRAAAASGVAVHLAGDGPQREALMAEVRRLSAPVTFHGHLEVSRLREVIAASRVTVLPAQWYENCPMSVLESYAMGKPVIGAAIGGLPELIEQDVTGTTFAAGSVEDLADSLRRFRDMPDAQVTAMGRACRDYVATRHSPEGYQAMICDVYREAGWQV